MPCKVDWIGTFIRRDSIDHWKFLQRKNYVWDRPTNIPLFLFSFWGGWTLCAVCSYWESWLVASRVRLTPTKTQNKGKSSDSKRSLLYRSGGGLMGCPIWYEMPRVGVEPNFLISNSWALYR